METSTTHERRAPLIRVCGAVLLAVGLAGLGFVIPGLDELDDPTDELSSGATVMFVGLTALLSGGIAAMGVALVADRATWSRRLLIAGACAAATVLFVYFGLD